MISSPENGKEFWAAEWEDVNSGVPSDKFF